MKTIVWMAKLATIGMFALLFATGCKKDDPVTPDREALLTGGAWKLSAMTVDPAIDWFGTPVTNVFPQLPACLKDDLTIFKTNGTVNYDEGASKCSPNDPQTTSGTWTFNPAQTVLSITTDGETTSWDIKNLTSTTVGAEYEITEEGITYTFLVSYSRQ